MSLGSVRTGRLEQGVDGTSEVVRDVREADAWAGAVACAARAAARPHLLPVPRAPASLPAACDSMRPPCNGLVGQVTLTSRFCRASRIVESFSGTRLPDRLSNLTP